MCDSICSSVSVESSRRNQKLENTWAEAPTTCGRMSKQSMSHLPFRNFVHLSQEEAYDLMHRMLSGSMTTEEIADVLSYLRSKGETISELVGFATAIRDLSNPVHIDQSVDPLLDTCGTGGDDSNTFNVSTATAFVVAGTGVRVAKHGNRRISSRCGSADVLEALGVTVDISPEQVADCIEKAGIGFLYAPVLHPAVRHSLEARLLLKGRTAFNLLGPLTNPVRARMQLIGAFSPRAAEMLAQAAARLGIERAFVVHGHDGLDEITTTGRTTVFQVEEGRVQKGSWSPVDFGLSQMFTGRPAGRGSGSKCRDHPRNLCGRARTETGHCCREFCCGPAARRTSFRSEVRSVHRGRVHRFRGSRRQTEPTGWLGESV